MGRVSSPTVADPINIIIRAICSYLYKATSHVHIAARLSYIDSEVVFCSLLPNIPLQSYFLKSFCSAIFWRSSVTYGIVETNNPTSVETFFRQVFQPFVMRSTIKDTTSTDPPSLSGILPQKRRKFLLPTTVLSNHRTLTYVNRLIYLLGAEMIHRVSVVLNEPNLFVPEEALQICQQIKDVERNLEVVSFISNIEELLLHWVEQINFFVFQIGLRQSQTENGLLFQIHENREKINILKEFDAYCESSSVNMFICLQKKIHCFNPLFYKPSTNEVGDFLYSTIKQKFLETFERKSGSFLSSHSSSSKIFIKVPPRPFWTTPKRLFLLLSQIRETMPQDFDSVKEEQKSPSSSKVNLEERNILHSSLELILKCCNSWEENYSTLYDQSSEKREEAPEMFPPLPCCSSVLLPVNLFKARCEDLKFIWESKIQLSSV
ncbi:hypothetical protein Avbf_01877 [Armadillidium vulgare]|nr:hypothetical protein Avbf_01877 [Armadillidium vulgare]